MAAYLVNLATGERWNLGGSVFIGRSPESNVQISDPRASRRHAMIREQDDGCWFYDLGSFNGSYLNRNRVTTTRKLENEDVIRIADIEFRFESAKGPSPPDQSADLGATIPLIRKMPVIVLVSDIIGYTQLAESLPADELAQAIGTWYGDCDEILGGYGATIDKFIGDAVLAYWSQVGVEARTQALQAASGLLQACDRIQHQHAGILEEKGLGFQSGISLHLGEVASGRIGQGELTLLGDAVNLGFRIEELTRTLDTPVLVSAAFLDNWEAGRQYCASLGAQPIKGRANPIELFSVEQFP